MTTYEMDGMIIGLTARLAREGCQNLTDAEMQRCFSQTVAPECCLKRAQRFRDEGLLTMQHIEQVKDAMKQGD